jgi:hypothetical protein
MGKGPFLALALAICLVACTPEANNGDAGLRLVQDVTLAPTTPAPTRVLSATPPPVVTSELISPLEVVTLQADFVLVTPTLPPSKTPTQTPTITQTPTQTPTPTVTVTATATAPVFPTSFIVPVTAVISLPLPQVCDSTWFFIQPRPANCPLNAPLASQGVFQQFQNGYMVWVQQQDAVYVLYNDPVLPRWQAFNDQFNEGMAEDDPAFANAPLPGTWQPRRGFGMLWRANSVVRQRIGWAVEQWERPYSVRTQTASDGAIFVSEPGGGVFSLIPGGTGWERYSSYSGFAS